MNFKKNIGNSLKDFSSLSVYEYPKEKIVNIQTILLYSKESFNFQNPIYFNDLVYLGIDNTLFEEILFFIIDKFKNYTFWWYQYHEVFADDLYLNKNFIKLNNFFIKNNLEDKLFFIDNNLKKIDFPFSYFGLPGLIGSTFNDKNTSKLERKFEKHFISFNRKEKPHRKDLYDFLNKNDLLDNTFLSYATNDINNTRYTLLENENLTESPKRQFVSEYQYKSFCNIITETDYSDRMIHITEKTDKCFSALQPFILIAGPYYLEKLRELGFKTFGNWWDESYDLETNYQKRIYKIQNVIKKISEVSLDECQSIYSEMIPILKHNYNLCNEISVNNKIHLEYWKNLYFEI